MTFSTYFLPLNEQSKINRKLSFFSHYNKKKFPFYKSKLNAYLLLIIHERIINFGGCLTRRPPQVTSQSPVVFMCILFLIINFKIRLTCIIYDYDE